jgi:type IV pilus assembly protein PilM
MGIFSSELPSYLGVDIGASGVKIVELKKEGDKARLTGYAFSENASADASIHWNEDNAKTAQLVREAINKANLTATKAIVGLPSYAVFISFINLVNIDKKNIEQAVTWEVKKIIPVPIEEVNLEWRLTESRIENNKEHLKVFITAVPKILVQKYRDIFTQAKLNLVSLEPEIFSLTRAFIGRDKGNYAIIDIGASTTNLSIIERGIPVLNRSLDLGGEHLTKTIAKGCQVSFDEAEQLKYDLGINAHNFQNANINVIMTEAISPIINEIKYLLSLFEKRGSGKVEKIILSGGSAMLVNLASYMESVMDITTIVADPWSRISYPLELEPLLKEIGPKLSTAAGLALSFLE